MSANAQSIAGGRASDGVVQRTLVLVYGVVSYALFFATVLYLIGFIGGLLVPKAIDTGAATAWPLALGINLALVALFGLQHSVMARQGFKRWWTAVVPPPAERSTYVLASSVILALAMGLWQPMPATVWSVDNAIGYWALWGLFGLGWLVLLLATFMVDHFDLFGLRQVWLHARAKPYTAPQFQTPAFYRYVRHPIYVGFLLGFWAIPEMSVGHLVFAAGMTAYIVIGASLEERDLMRAFGDAYRRYRRQVPMFMPRPWARGRGVPASE